MEKAKRNIPQVIRSLNVLISRREKNLWREEIEGGVCPAYWGRRIQESDEKYTWLSWIKEDVL